MGDAGNPNDHHTGYGGVSYGYHIGTYEVTNSQYAAFLNGTAKTDTHGLYDTRMGSYHGGITRTGRSGSYTYSVKAGMGDKPVNYVSFWDAARFTNWLTSGDTENGVYVLTSGGITGNTIARDATAWNNGGVAIASKNEWHKAAYYDGSGGYWQYPTASHLITTANANYGLSVGTVTDVGTYSGDASYYGTFDQGGNVSEWNDEIVVTVTRRTSGGSYALSQASDLRNTALNNNMPTNEGSTLGFRVSSLEPIPEPSTYAAILECLGLTLALMRRKGRGTL